MSDIFESLVVLTVVGAILYIEWKMCKSTVNLNDDIFEADYGNAGDDQTEEAVTQVSEESDWCGFFEFIEFD